MITVVSDDDDDDAKEEDKSCSKPIVYHPFAHFRKRNFMF